MTRPGNQFLSLVLVALALLSRTAFPKNLADKIGVGVTYHDFNNTAALSGRYYISQPLAVSVLLGLNTGAAGKTLTLGAKVHRLLYLEENLNFYIGLGGFFLHGVDPSNVASTGIELEGLFGAEFFLSGLPNLGFQLEGGLAIRSVGTTAIKSFGGVFSGAGVHYYF